MKAAKAKKQDLIFILSLFLITLVLWLGYRLFFSSQGELSAVVTVDGKEAMIVPLQDETIQEFDLNEKFTVDVILQKEGRKIRFLHSDCPDQICLGFGAIEKEQESAVCMPNRVAIVLVPTSQLK